MHVPAELLRALSSRYRIERELGHGGMADVYLAYDIKQKRQVALKVMNRALAVERERFDDEIKTLANLVAPHIVSVFDSGVEADSLYYTMQFVDGETLAERIARVGPLPIEDVWRIGREVADALKSAHASGVIHRDIKPGNILLTADHAWVADFGIAKAITENVPKATPWSTATGVLLGTPPYMSPEQASSGAVLDGRTDIYSLGCVLYEALTGRPPFQGDTPQSVLASHLSDPAPSIRRLRRDVPPGLARIVKKALEKRREDRFASAAALLEALRVGDVPATPVRDVARWVADHWLPVGATALAALALGVWLRSRAVHLDASLYVVVPFAHRVGAAPTLLNGDQCELLLSQRIGRWPDIRVVPSVLVRDRIERHGITVMTFEAARRVARALRGGRLVWGDVSEPDDSITVTAGIYDLTRGDSVLQQHTVRIDQKRTSLAPRFNELADSLLFGFATSPGASAAALGTESYAAWEAFAVGQIALERWELDSAERAFRGALAVDGSFPHAQFGLAHTLMWGGRPGYLWRDYAEAAAGHAAVLGRRDSAVAGALFALAQQNYPRACAEYARVLERDSLSFAGWFGLAECHARDSIVVRDGASRSGWRFRSSFHTAAAAYERAFRLVPSMYRAFRGPRFSTLLLRLQRVLHTEGRKYRAGYAVGSDTIWFASFPELTGDTLGFVPFPRALVFAGGPRVRPRSQPAAVRRSRDALLRIIAAWTDEFPANADVNEALAHVLETRGEIAEARPSNRSALETVRNAHRLTVEPGQAIRLEAAEVRLLLKLGRFAEAERLADVELERHPDPSPVDAARLIGLAALTGRGHRAAQLSTRAAADDPLGQLDLAQTSSALRAYAALGQPVDSIITLAARTRRLVQQWIGPARRQRLLDTLLTNPAMWAFPYLGVPRTVSFWADLQRAVQQADTGAVRAAFDGLSAIRRDVTPGEVALDKTYQEAIALVAIGDSVRAASHLDSTLEALPTIGTRLLDRVEQAAALGRAMELRVRLADRVGDAATARRWAEALSILWSEADVPALRAVADSMRVLSRRRG